jgi:hypothetical protein
MGLDLKLGFGSYLLSSGLYRRFRNRTGSAVKACGLYRRSGYSPCPEDTGDPACAAESVFALGKSYYIMISVNAQAQKTPTTLIMSPTFFDAEEEDCDLLKIQ